MAYFPVKIYFVNSCEVVSFTVSDRIQSPFAALQRIVCARGLDHFTAAWSDEYHNFFPLKSDRGFIDALRSRSHHLQPLRIFVKEALPPRGNYRSCGYEQTTYPGPRNLSSCDISPSMEPWRAHKVAGPKNSVPETPRMQTHSQSVNLPKDPSLAELVDKVRVSLDMVASMHTSQTSAAENEENTPPALAHENEASVPLSVVSDAPDTSSSKLLSECPVEPMNMQDHQETGLLVELLEDYADEEARLLDLPRPASALSDFMVITPSSDSCVHFSMADFEAAISDFDDEDTFEIVDATDVDDWDSDIEWKELESVK